MPTWLGGVGASMQQSAGNAGAAGDHARAGLPRMAAAAAGVAGAAVVYQGTRLRGCCVRVRVGSCVAAASVPVSCRAPDRLRGVGWAGQSVVHVLCTHVGSSSAAPCVVHVRVLCMWAG